MSILLKEYIRILLEKHYTDVPTRMIAAYPNKDSIKKIIKYRNSLSKPSDIERILEPDELHCTMRWWSVEDNDNTSKISKFLNKQDFSEIIAIPTNIQNLGDSIVIMLESDELHEYFTLIDNGIKKIGVPPSDFPTYKPHISLWKGKEIPKQKDLDFEIVFDRIDLVDHNDKIHWSSKAEDDVA